MPNKGYLWLAGLLCLEAVIVSYGRLTDFTVLDGIRIVFLIVGVIGVCGYVYQRAVISKWFWRMTTVIAPLWDLYLWEDFFVGPEATISRPEVQEFLGDMLAAAAIYFALHVALVVVLYLYAFRSAVWAQRPG